MPALALLVRGHLEDVFAVEQHLSGIDHVLGVARQRVGQRGFAGSVRPHDGMGFTGVDGQVHAFEDRLDAVLGFDVRVQIFDFKS